MGGMGWDWVGIGHGGIIQRLTNSLISVTFCKDVCKTV
jgi:hypothetical protein